jgi:hypothetical protein
MFKEEAIKRGLAELFGWRIGGKNDDVRACLLIRLLPQLEEVSINPVPNSKLGLYHTYLSTMMEQRLLSTKLRVWERGDEKLREEGFRIVELIPVMLYPLMNVVKAYHVVSGRLFPRLDRCWTKFMFNIGQSTVESIEFSRPDVTIEDLTEILKLPRALKRFVYKDGNIQWGMDNVINGMIKRRVLERALEPAMQTLEVLDLELTNSGGEGTHSLPLNETLFSETLFSLHRFVALKMLAIRFATLANYDRLAPPYGAPPTVCLTDLLPPLLEDFTVYHCRWEYSKGTEYLDCVKKVLQGKSATCLTHLKVMKCKSRLSIPLSNSIFQLACDQGVAFTFVLLPHEADDEDENVYL